MLSCKDITALASDHIEKKLPFFKRLQFKMHLFMCHNCRGFVDQLALTIRSLRTLKKPKVDEQIINQQVESLLEISKNLHKH